MVARLPTEVSTVERLLGLEPGSLVAVVRRRSGLALLIRESDAGLQELDQLLQEAIKFQQAAEESGG